MNEIIYDIRVWIDNHLIHPFRKIYYGFRNFWWFRKEIWNFRCWDYHYNLDVLARSVELTANGIEKYGLQIGKTKSPMIEKMRRFVWLVRNYDNTIKLAEDELGIVCCTGDIFLENGQLNITDDDRTVFRRSKELEMEMWDEMWKIIRGTENETITSTSGQEFNVSTDGTDMRGWWD